MMFRLLFKEVSIVISKILSLDFFFFFKNNFNENQMNNIWRGIIHLYNLSFTIKRLLCNTVGCHIKNPRNKNNFKKL